MTTLDKQVKETPYLEMGKEAEQLWGMVNPDKTTYVNRFELVNNIEASLLKIHTLYSDTVHKDYFIIYYAPKINLLVGESFYYTILLLKSYNISDISSLLNYYEQLLKEKNLYDAIFFPDNPLDTFLAYGKSTSINDGLYFRIKPWLYTQDDEFYAAKLSKSIDYIEVLLKEIVSLIKTFKETLEIQDLSKPEFYQEAQSRVMESFIRLTRIYDYMGFQGVNLARVTSVFINIKNLENNG